jgi:hypothetical protein
LDLWSKEKGRFGESTGHEKVIKIEVTCWKPGGGGKSLFKWKDNIQGDFNEMCLGTELTDIKIKPNGGVS